MTAHHTSAAVARFKALRRRAHQHGYALEWTATRAPYVSYPAAPYVLKTRNTRTVVYGADSISALEDWLTTAATAEVMA